VLKNISEKRGNNGEPSRDGNARDDSRTGRAFSTTTNPVRKEYTGNAQTATITINLRVGPRVVNPLNSRNPTATRGACFECGGMDHCKTACPRLNQAPRPGGNRLNQAMAIDGGQGRGNNGDQVCGRAFMMGAGKACHDPNIVTGTFTLDN
ncbi:hypothetical protein Tco_0372162, partial [Tanacetum coccineum]